MQIFCVMLMGVFAGFLFSVISGLIFTPEPVEEVELTPIVVDNEIYYIPKALLIYSQYPYFSSFYRTDY